MCIHRYSIIQNIFTALKILCAPPIHLSLPSDSWKPLILLLSPEFCLSSKCHRDRIMQYVAFSAEKAMAPHSSALAWKIPWTEEPGGLQSMGSLSQARLSDFPFTFMHWRRKWQPTPVFLPGGSQGWGSLVGCCLWGRTESDMTEAT